MPVWQKKVKEHEKWQDQQARSIKLQNKTNKKRGKDDEGGSKQDRDREKADAEASSWQTFDPDAPIDGFHFADTKQFALSELRTYQNELVQRGVMKWLADALERGIAVHHASMNRRYRYKLEIIYRKGYLLDVIATGTLALGINMPCKTVVFSGDSLFLTALNYRQAGGRAGRRGFDVLGNVVFQGVDIDRVYKLMSSRLPHLQGHFPITTSLVLRLFLLLSGSKNSEFAIRTIDSILSQPRLYLGSMESKVSILHHLRFSIEYLRQNFLLDQDGTPMNFALWVSHLYYAENSCWAFHALLKEGYFHALSADVDKSPVAVCRTLMLVMAHIFGRRTINRALREAAEAQGVQSTLYLPPIPEEVEAILQNHNAQTLGIFHTYVKTFAKQHLAGVDNELPLTGVRIGPEHGRQLPTSLPATVVRSPFVALSGHGDEFETISDLCRTVRSGVFLEEAAVPYLPICPRETGASLNAYLYNFYMHGDIKALENVNRIRSGEVWFLLNGTFYWT